MPKFWEEMLVQAENEGKIIRIKIGKKEYHNAFGEYAFTIPGLREWVKSNEEWNIRPEPWAGVEDVIYFTIKDQWVDYFGNHDDEVPIGFHMNVYSNDERFRNDCYLCAQNYFNKKNSLKVKAFGERDEVPILAWKYQPDSDFVERILNWVPRFVTNILIKKNFER